MNRTNKTLAIWFSKNKKSILSGIFFGVFIELTFLNLGFLAEKYFEDLEIKDAYTILSIIISVIASVYYGTHVSDKISTSKSLLNLLNSYEKYVLNFTQNFKDMNILKYHKTIRNFLLNKNYTNVEEKYNQILENWNEKIKTNNQWRILLEKLLNSQYDEINNNKFTLSLKCYLDVLLDYIKFYEHLCNESHSKLVIHSFTNAIPNDWFEETNEIVGDEMSQYRRELISIIDNWQKNNSHKYLRTVLCLDDNLTDNKFQSFEEVRKKWLQLNKEERDNYLNYLHTNINESQIFILKNEIKFVDDFSELIYFGIDNSSEVDWKFCFKCGFTNNNTNVVASFIDLKKITDSIIEISDKHLIKHLNDYPDISTPDTQNICISEFINKKINPKLSNNIVLFKELASLGVKWNLASHIWHDYNTEKRILSEIINHCNLKADDYVLDLACGTGFHGNILNEFNFKLYLSDYDSTNINLAKNQYSSIKNVFVANWFDINSHDEISKNKYDAIFCIGSSISYFESWNEDVKDLKLDRKALDKVLKNFAQLLNENGYFVLGFSRHYDEQFENVNLNIGRTLIDNIEYSMSWNLKFDWINHIKNWSCLLKGQNKENYTFNLVSHLYSKKDLVEYCTSHFKTAEVIDIDPGYYDLFLICSNK